MRVCLQQVMVKTPPRVLVEEQGHCICGWWEILLVCTNEMSPKRLILPNDAMHASEGASIMIS